MQTYLSCKLNEHAAGCVAQESRNNLLRDFVDIAGPLGVSHFMILTATENAAYLRIAKTPRVRLSWRPGLLPSDPLTHDKARPQACEVMKCLADAPQRVSVLDLGETVPHA